MFPFMLPHPAQVARGTLMIMVCLGASGAFAETAPDYAKDIRPLLKARCYACHGALKQKSGLRLDTVASMHKGSDDGDVIKTDASLLLARITAAKEDERMPPEGTRLTPEQITAFREWIAAGAPAPADDQPEPDPRAHWAFQPPQR